MKLAFNLLLAAFIAAPLAFADCGKCKDKDKEKKEETVLADCGPSTGRSAS